MRFLIAYTHVYTVKRSAIPFRLFFNLKLSPLPLGGNLPCFAQPIPILKILPKGHFCPLVHTGLSRIMDLLPLWLDYLSWLYRNLFPVSAKIVPIWWIPKWIPRARIPGAHSKTAFSVRTRAAQIARIEHEPGRYSDFLYTFKSGQHKGLMRMKLQLKRSTR